jgi:adenylosuccinate synthase
MDVIYDDQPVKVCVGYKQGNKKVVYRPDQEFLSTVDPVYKELKPWDAKKLAAARTYAELPKEAKVFLEFIAEEIGAPVMMITTGPQREQGILFQEAK